MNTPNSNYTNINKLSELYTSYNFSFKNLPV